MIIVLAGFLFEPRRKVATGVPPARVLRRVPRVARTRSRRVAPSRSVHKTHGPRPRCFAVGRSRCVWSGLTQPPRSRPPCPPRGGIVPCFSLDVRTRFLRLLPPPRARLHSTRRPQSAWPPRSRSRALQHGSALRNPTSGWSGFCALAPCSLRTGHHARRVMSSPLPTGHHARRVMSSRAELRILHGSALRDPTRGASGFFERPPRNRTPNPASYRPPGPDTRRKGARPAQ